MDVRPRIAAQWAAIREYVGGEISARSLFTVAFWPVACLGAAWVLALGGKPGADFHRYQAWSEALSHGDIFRISSAVASPLGLPLSVHSVGPGMLLSIGRAWFGRFDLHLRPDFVFMGLAALCAWWALMRLILRLTAGNLPVCALVMGLGFVGTHLGYYSWSYSSELASFFALSVLYYFAIATERIGLFEALLIGVASGLSVVMRTQLAMYVALACAVAAFRAYVANGRTWRTALLALVALVPCLILALEAAYVSRWMTGSFLRTPYQFGDQQWQSVDWRRPEFSAVLLHPRHGLLAYHPLYFVCFACAVYLMATARDWHQRALAGAVIAIALLHLYLQAAWFCWWLGTFTFGMRGMATLALLLLPALAVTLDQRQRVGKPIWPLVIACVAATAWSMLLYFQNETNFNTWAQLWKSQSVTFAQPMVFVLAVISPVIGIVSWIVWRRTSAPRLTAAAGAAVSLAIAAAAHAWVQRNLLKELHWSELHAAWDWAVAIALIGAGASAALGLRPLARPTFRATEIIVGCFVLAFAYSASVQFLRLAKHTEAYLRMGEQAPVHFDVASPILWDEIEASYEEYKSIPGFDASKQRFWAFLQRHSDDWAFVQRQQLQSRPSPRRRRSRPK